jgi:hypothetical protein
MEDRRAPSQQAANDEARRTANLAGTGFYQQASLLNFLGDDAVSRLRARERKRQEQLEAASRQEAMLQAEVRATEAAAETVKQDHAAQAALLHQQLDVSATTVAGAAEAVATARRRRDDILSMLKRDLAETLEVRVMALKEEQALESAIASARRQMDEALCRQHHLLQQINRIVDGGLDDAAPQ